ncbi:MAG: cytochrome b [Alphaproteobacteria bacterium]|nr:cytochrome b [Alphaproteobacteria bacterium]
MGERYTPVARAFHWTTAALVLTMVPLGLALSELRQGRIQDFGYDLHRSIGVVLFPLVVARLLYRLSHPAPPLPATMPAWQQRAAMTVHGALYLLLLLNPLVGWWGTSAYGAPITVFWLFALPPLVAKNQGLGEAILYWHGWTGLSLATLIAAHIGAALQHHLIQRDGILRRMWP